MRECLPTVLLLVDLIILLRLRRHRRDAIVVLPHIVLVRLQVAGMTVPLHLVGGECVVAAAVLLVGQVDAEVLELVHHVIALQWLPVFVEG